MPIRLARNVAIVPRLRLHTVSRPPILYQNSGANETTSTQLYLAIGLRAMF